MSPALQPRWAGISTDGRQVVIAVAVRCVRVREALRTLALNKWLELGRGDGRRAAGQAR